MIDLFLKYAANPAVGPELSAAMEELIGTAGQGPADLVQTALPASQFLEALRMKLVLEIIRPGWVATQGMLPERALGKRLRRRQEIWPPP
jgi:hypothetical protein